MWFFFVFVFLNTLFGKPLQVEVSAPSAILMNGESGAILFEKNSSLPSYPASITKIATALFVLDKKMQDVDQLLTVSSESLRVKPLKAKEELPAYWLEVDGTKMGLQSGEVLSLDALLHGLMLISGNDAANVIAEGVAGSVPLFMEELNQYLKEMGCQNTQFQNPHGLHHPDHFTTAYDICLITKRALSIPKFREIVSKPLYIKPKTNKQDVSLIRHTNPLLKEGKFHYPKAIGVKTGFHSVAKNTFVAAAEHEGRVLIGVFLGCAKREDRYEDALRLFETAFQEEKEEECYFSSGHFFNREIEGAKIPLQAILSEDLKVSYYLAEEPAPKAFVHWQVPQLPISKGKKVGELHVVDERGKLLNKKDLFAKQTVEPTLLFQLKSLMKFKPSI